MTHAPLPLRIRGGLVIAAHYRLFKTSLKAGGRRRSLSTRQRTSLSCPCEKLRGHRRTTRHCRRTRKEMTAGVAGLGLVEEQQLQRQMGCMAGFFQLFDRSQILSGKRLYPTRRLASSPGLGSTSPSGRSDASASFVFKESHQSPFSEPFSSPEMSPLDDAPPRPSLPLPLPVFDFKDGMRTSWKIHEVPRLSLDSRAVLDAKGKLRPRDIRTTIAVSSSKADATESAESEMLRQSPGVVARLMGLDTLPGNGGTVAPANNSSLRRSSSESRVARDPSCARFVHSSSFEKLPPEPTPISAEEFFKRANAANFKVTTAAKKHDLSPQRSVLHTIPLQRKSFFDAQDIFPEPKRSSSVFGKKLRKQGLDEQARDLDTLKQTLEAVQLKGLLRFNHSGQTASRRNLIYGDDSRISGESPIVLMKPVPRPPRRTTSESPPPSSRSVAWRRSPSASPDAFSPSRRDPRSVGLANDRRNRTPRSPDNPSSPAKRVTKSPELRKRSPTQPRTNAVSSPMDSPRRFNSAVAVRSPRIRRQPTPESSSKGRIFSPTEDDTSTTISDSSLSASSPTEFERSRTDDCRSGRNLLKRCDKLLDSIAAFVEQQPSPMSVLDSSNYFGGGESSPSPVALTKRFIDFKDRHGQLVEDWEEDHWSHTTPTGSNNEDDSIEVDDEEADVDYAYVSEILRNDDAAPGDAFAALEKRWSVSDPSKASRLHRRLVFDAVAEILDRKRRVSPWKAFARSRSVAFDAPGECNVSLRHLWGELCRIRVQVVADDLNGVTCGAVRKDMEGDERIDGWGWGPHPAAAEMSDAVLHIERQIFKDLVADAIQDLADASVKSSRHSSSRRKLVF